MKIIVIGTGWYGSYISYILQNNHEVILLEKENVFFKQSSYYNQNRLHMGYHYPRSYDTRELCKDSYKKFMEKFPFLFDDLENNYYGISNESLVDFDTYKYIFQDYNHKIKNVDYFNNINKSVFKVDEKVINTQKVRKFFKKNLKNVNIIFNYKVEKLENVDNKVVINNDIVADFCFNCTNNQLTLSNQQFTYEKTLSLVYERINKKFDYDALTVIDGDFSSIYPYKLKKNQYTLTNVKHTPLIKSTNIKNVLNFEIDENLIKEKIKRMNQEIIKYIPSFNDEYVYKSYFISFKTKLLSNDDSRVCNINKDGNIVSINCCKISGIFTVEDYIKNELKI